MRTLKFAACTISLTVLTMLAQAQEKKGDNQPISFQAQKQDSDAQGQAQSSLSMEEALELATRMMEQAKQEGRPVNYKSATASGMGQVLHGKTQNQEEYQGEEGQGQGQSNISQFHAQYLKNLAMIRMLETGKNVQFQNKYGQGQASPKKKNSLLVRQV